MEEFRKDENPRTAIDIYERFVRVGAPHQVNLPHTIREAVDKVMDRWRGLSDEVRECGVLSRVRGGFQT